MLRRLKRMLDTIRMFLGLKDIPVEPRKDWEEKFQQETEQGTLPRLDPEPEVIENFGVHSNGYLEPPSTGKLGTITSFLWKPESDNTGHPIVLVSCDEVPTSELFIEILNKNGNPMRSVDSKAFSRGNKLSTRKFARISFRLGVPLSRFKTSAPLEIKFFQMIDGKRVDVPLRGRKTQIVRRPAQRVEWT